MKTRLAKKLGPESACQAYRTLVEAVLEAIAPWREVELRFSPDDAAAEVAPWLMPGWRAAPQGPGDLGERLGRAFEEALPSAKRTIIIGSDCPEIAMADLEEAQEALDDHDVVLGPAVDGGYWLIGLRQPQPALFRGVAWSSASVLEQTLANAAAEQLSVHLLRILNDVDTVADWERWRGRTG